MTIQLPPLTHDASLAHLLTDSRNVVPTSARHSVPCDCALTGLPGTNGDRDATGVEDGVGDNFCGVTSAAGAGGNAVVGAVVIGFAAEAGADGFTFVATWPTGGVPFAGAELRGCVVADIGLLARVLLPAAPAIGAVTVLLADAEDCIVVNAGTGSG